MRIARYSSAAILGGMSVMLAAFGAWAFIAGFRPHYETPGFFFTILALVAWVSAAMFAVPALTLTVMPRAVGWWIIASVACSFAAAVLIWVLLAAAVNASFEAIIPTLFVTLGLIAVTVFVRTFITTLRQSARA